MPIYKLKLIDRKEVARGTIEFIFEKPEGFSFKPGQYGGFTLAHISLTSPGSMTRRFSILSTPQDKHLTIASRMQNSDYKNVLKDLPLGSEIKFAGPTGNFVLHEDAVTPAVFIAGGIGVTPFYCMIRDALQKNSTQALTLFYGNQAIYDAAYLTELQQLEHEHANFKIIPVMATDPEWQGETGFISYEIIKKYVSNLNAPIYYVCGSPMMVKALHETLNELGVSEEKIKAEDFPGY